MLILETVVTRSPGLHAARISEQELVILGQDSEHYFGLDETGVAIWDQLAEPKRISQVIDSLAAEFEAERKTIEKDVMAFIEKLLNERVLQVHG